MTRSPADAGAALLSRLVILGAGGDLALRYLFPALGEMAEARLLPGDLDVVAVDREEIVVDAFRGRVAEALDREAGDLSIGAAETLLGAIAYRVADVTDQGQAADACGVAEAPAVIYLALPPALFEPVVAALGAAAPDEGTCVVVEKPFGEDLASAERLNGALRRRLPQVDVHRVDHFLGMQTVQNVLGVHFANRVFETLWNAGHVERVEIAWDERLTVEETWRIVEPILAAWDAGQPPLRDYPAGSTGPSV